MRELTARGVEFTGGIQDAEFGRVTFMKLPGDLRVMLYQPSYRGKPR